MVGLHGGFHRRLLHSDVLHPLRLRVAWREGHDALLRQELRQVPRHLHPARPRHQLRESIIIVIISSIVLIAIFTPLLSTISWIMSMLKRHLLPEQEESKLRHLHQQNVPLEARGKVMSAQQG